MATILWSALNVVIILGLLYAAGQAIWLLRQRFGWRLAAFFGLGLLVLVGRGSPGPAIATSNLLGGLPSHAPLANASATQNFALGGGLRLTLLVEYTQDAATIKPRGLYPIISGIVLGHSWRPVTGSAEQVGQRLHCLAVLEHKWLILGMPIFSETQEYAGLLPLGKPAA